MSPRGIEIERKFRLRAAPSQAALAAHAAVAKRMEQVYLRPAEAAGRQPAEADRQDRAQGGGERVRRIEMPDGAVSYRHTTKRRTGAFSWDEAEEPIDEAEWADALRRADPDRRTIRKTRHVVANGDQTLEIDVFDDPPGLVVVEVELRSEDEAVELPQWLGEWHEVTRDERYLNARLAHRDAEVPPFDGG